MRRLKIQHATSYEYGNRVTLQPHKLLLRPREGHNIRIESSRLKIAPDHHVKWLRDVYGNSAAIVTFQAPTTLLTIFSEVVIQHYEDAPLDFLVADYAVSFPFFYDASERLDLSPYQMSLFPDNIPSLSTWLEQFWHRDQPVETYALLANINETIATEFSYNMREEPGVQSPAETLATRSGSCRDYATLFIEAARYLGFAARFVSGYLHSPATVQGDGSTHAWSEIYLPGAGWKGFDSTSGRVVGQDHIAAAVSRHPEAIPPVCGSFAASTPQNPVMKVSVEVSEIETRTGETGNEQRTIG